ncbi:hypothetical protein OHS33_12210 [Streptomyces sp. NBC_00536]|uniref:hypothetical protein n=1 Tax=Streptomyces sp. NBC_00536 TaxID=2975769 RepID=UPI002E81F390|nr:hypothetical protein [Streptomyces sp. NBC_00536]WUC79034.1 hypothetical protein OHS33_12210 [Streptomyces sp. NBC_00536]
MADLISRGTAARRFAARYAFGLGIVVCLASGAYLTMTNTADTVPQKLSDLGVSLVGSAVFAVVFALLSDRENRSLIRSEISLNFLEHSRSMLREWQSDNGLYLPDATYPATDGFDRAFNTALMEAFERSSSFYFRGTSAKYLPARIKASRRCPSSVKVFIPGPTAAAAVRTRVADRLKNPKYAASNAGELFDALLEEMISSFVGLYDCRAYCSVDVAFSPDTSVTRVELTDSRVFVSWFHAPDADRRPFPLTVAFRPGSFAYQVHRLDLVRRHDIADDVIHIRRDLTEREMCDLLSSRFARPFSPADLARYSEAYWRGMEGFLDFLRTTNA